MAFSWSTFFLEILNFLVLIWILKRFLYQPVLDVIAKRQADVTATLDSARAQTEQAHTLQQQFEQRLADWQTERQQKLDALTRDIAEQRQQRLQQLDEELQAHRQKALALADEQAATEKRQLEVTAIQHGSAFVARLLSDLADPQLHAHLIEFFIKELGDDVAETPWQTNHNVIEVDITSAYALDTPTRESLQTALARVLKNDALNFNYAVDPSLLAGLIVELDGWSLGANLRDELSAFAELGAAGSTDV